MMQVSIPKGWASAKLREVAELERDSIQPADISSGTTYVGLEHIVSDGTFLNVASVEDGELASSKFSFGPDHLLYGKLRPYLRKIVRPDFHGVCSTDILPIKPSARINKDYLFYYLRQPSMVELATSRCSGANLPRLSPQTLLDFPIVFPPLPEQKRIAAILDKADSIRRKRQEAVRLTEELLRSVFLDMFGDPVTNPKGWETLSMEEIILDGPQNGLYKHESDYGSGTLIVRIDSFYDGEVTGIDKLKRVRLDAGTIQKYQLHEDDLLVNRVNSRKFLGKSAIVPALQEHTVFESNMMRITVNKKIVCPHYLVSLLQHQYIKTQIDNKAKDAVNQSSINQDDVKSFELRVPPLELQAEFKNRKKKINGLFLRQNEAVEHENTLFNSLLQRVFKGELLPMKPFTKISKNDTRFI